MEPIVPIAVVTSLILGALIAFIAFGSYFRNRKSDVISIAKPTEPAATNLKNSRNQQTKKSQSKPHHSHADKVYKGRLPNGKLVAVKRAQQGSTHVHNFWFRLYTIVFCVGESGLKRNPCLLVRRVPRLVDLECSGGKHTIG